MGIVLWEYEDKSQIEKEQTILSIYLIIFVLLGFLANNILPIISLGIFGVYLIYKNNYLKSKKSKQN